MNKRRYFILTFIFLIYLIPTKGQQLFIFPTSLRYFNDEINPTPYGKENGSSSDNIKSLLRNSEFLWIGNSKGLSLFDGLLFPNFSKSEQAYNGAVGFVNIAYIKISTTFELLFGYSQIEITERLQNNITNF